MQRNTPAARTITVSTAVGFLAEVPEAAASLHQMTTSPHQRPCRAFDRTGECLFRATAAGGQDAWCLQFLGHPETPLLLMTAASALQFPAAFQWLSSAPHCFQSPPRSPPSRRPPPPRTPSPSLGCGTNTPALATGAGTVSSCSVLPACLYHKSQEAGTATDAIAGKRLTFHIMSFMAAG